MKLLPFYACIATLMCVLVACDQSGVIPTSPVSSAALDTPWVPTKDTSRKDTVTVVFAKLFPAVDSMQDTFALVSGGSVTRSWKITRKATDTTVKIPLDTGTGRVWRFSVTGYKGNRIWWKLDSVRVKPDSSRRIVLDSFYKRLKIADTTTPAVDTPVPPTDTLPVVLASALSGDPAPNAGTERGMFFTYTGGNLVVSLSSDGNAGITYDHVLGGHIAMAFSKGSLGTPVLVDYIGTRDNDSTSNLISYVDSANVLKALVGDIYSRYLLKTLTIPVAQCTVEVAISFSQGVQTNVSGWTMSALASDSVVPLVFLGSKRTHSTKAHFKIVIP